jgi:hypothetical protein
MCYTLFMGYEPISLFNLLFYIEIRLLHLGVWCMAAVDA